MSSKTNLVYLSTCATWFAPSLKHPGDKLESIELVNITISDGG